MEYYTDKEFVNNIRLADKLREKYNKNTNNCKNATFTTQIIQFISFIENKSLVFKETSVDIGANYDCFINECKDKNTITVFLNKDKSEIEKRFMIFCSLSSVILNSCDKNTNYFYDKDNNKYVIHNYIDNLKKFNINCKDINNLEIAFATTLMINNLFKYYKDDYALKTEYLINEDIIKIKKEIDFWLNMYTNRRKLYKKKKI